MCPTHKWAGILVGFGAGRASNAVVLSFSAMWLIISAIFGCAGVFLGAFGAHGLAGKVSPERLAAWSTAAHYQLIHTVALLALALYGKSAARSVSLPAILFTAGIVLFSGSIYLLVVTDQKWLGPITPIGGLCFAAGWLSLLTLAR